jgi:ribosomal protein S18 acetylase RimI-like enzyme
MDYTIEILEEADWKIFKELRLEALKNDSLAYGSSYEEEEFFTEAEWRKKFELSTWYTSRSGNAYVGLLGVLFEKAKKMEHTADLVGFYVQPEYRGRGIGRAMMERAIAELHANPKIIKLRLGVNVLQENAVKLYEDLGFKTACVIEKATKVDGIFYDHARMELIFRDKL